MGAPKEYTEEEVLSAVKGSASIISTVAKNLGCTWGTADKYIRMYPSCMEALSDECERVLDLAESKMIEHINKGDAQMIKYILSTKGKKRGYSEKQQVEHSGNVSAQFSIIGIDADTDSQED